MAEKPEILKITEKQKESKAESQPWECDLTPEEVEQICERRGQVLDTLRPFISLNFYNRLNEKLALERRQFQALLNIDDARKQFLAQYSLVLNPSYFEQKLWKT